MVMNPHNYAVNAIVHAHATMIFLHYGRCVFQLEQFFGIKLSLSAAIWQSYLIVRVHDLICSKNIWKLTDQRPIASR